MKVTIADIKADLAALGVDLSPSAEMEFPPPPTGKGRIGVIVLERVADVNDPDYCVHGFATCVNCDEICYLGDETLKVVRDHHNNTFPLCMPCANATLPAANAESAGTITDTLKGHP